MFVLSLGRNILAAGGMFTFTPTQMYCITRQLQLPHFAGEPTGTVLPCPKFICLKDGVAVEK